MSNDINKPISVPGKVSPTPEQTEGAPIANTVGGKEGEKIVAAMKDLGAFADKVVGFFYKPTSPTAPRTRQALKEKRITPERGQEGIAKAKEHLEGGLGLV